jgi:UrcA family protein
MTTRFAILAAALGAALSATPALAGPASVSISYADLNLATPQGQAKLDRRIDAAAKSSCGGTKVVTGSIVREARDPECVAAFKTAAHQQIASRTAQGTPKGG